MHGLSGEKCEACRVGAPRATEAEMAELKPLVKDWRIEEHEAILRLERSFVFPDFAQALDFTVRIGELAEREGHHPAILTEWGRVKVEWWTHKIGGLHRNDFVMAAKTDEVFAGRSNPA